MDWTMTDWAETSRQFINWRKAWNTHQLHDRPIILDKTHSY